MVFLPTPDGPVNTKGCPESPYPPLTAWRWRCFFRGRLFAFAGWHVSTLLVSRIARKFMKRVKSM